MNGALIFLTLSAFGQLVLLFLSRLILVPVADWLVDRDQVSSFTATDITVTVPLVLQVAWVAAVVAWLMQ